MVHIKAKGASDGIAIGELFFYESKEASVNNDESTDIETEISKYTKAKALAKNQLNKLIEDSNKKGLSEAADLFEVHIELIEDPDFNEFVTFSIESRHSCKFALNTAGDYFSSMFAEMNDTYMAERSRDILDITERLINIVGNNADAFALPEGKLIIVSDDLSPSKTVSLDKTKVVGFALREGAANGHNSILSSIMGIPLVIGAGNALSREFNGENAIIDGKNGDIIISPDERTLKTYLEIQNKDKNNKNGLSSLIGAENITRDKRKIDILCNIASPADIDAVIKNDGNGIGVFRSEFLYLGRKELPTEDEQFDDYKKVLSAMGNKNVIIRTLDIGSDKKAECLPLPKEENPALGYRAIRICLNQSDIFKTQLRALFRASIFGNLSIMFPMIANMWEIQKAKEICAEVRNELSAEGVPFSDKVRLGIMIETPSAALLSDEFAKEVDFFSIGTNDLTQYTLALDRQNANLSSHFDSHHPAVLKLIELTAENAHKNGIPVGICGEIAKDTELLPFFLSCKIDELSVIPNAVLLLRKAIREL